MRREISEEEKIEYLDRRKALMSIRTILDTEAGRVFFRFLFKEFEVGDLPPVGLDGSLLMDKIGSLRAGQVFFELAAEANPKVASAILAELKKEKYEKLYAELSNG